MKIHSSETIIKKKFYSIFPQDQTIWTLNKKDIWKYIYSFIKYVKEQDWPKNTNLDQFFSVINDIYCYKMYIFQFMHYKKYFKEFYDNFLYYLFKKFFDLFLCIYYGYYSFDDVSFIKILTDYFQLIISIGKEYHYVIDYTLNPSNQIAGCIPDEEDYLKVSEECLSFIEYSFKDNILYYKLNYKSEVKQFNFRINSKQVIKEKVYKYFFFRKVLKQFYDEDSLLNVLEGLGKSFMEETIKALKYIKNT